jgi:predicted AAA+ superfamily ATPase
MIPRTLGPHLARLAGPNPVVFLTGPRQSGKTTLARATFPSYLYVSLEDLEARELAIEDPRSFLRRLDGAEGVVIDEAQRAPDLFSYLQGFVDEQRAGPIVLTGSQHFLLTERISQTLAGRAAILELLPFSLAEIERRDALTPDEIVGRRYRRREAASGPDLDELLVSGLYPRIHDRGLEPSSWLDGYLRTYVERDIRTLTNVGDLDTFARFVRLCAGRAGQLLNMSAIGADAGVDQTTVNRWLSIMRTSYIVDLLQPHHVNFRKRLVKRPKLYFVDTGLLCHLLGIRTVEQLATHPLRGAVFENFVVGETRKSFLHHAERPPLYFWRDSRGREIDLLIEWSGELVPIEIKAGRTVAHDFFDGLDFYASMSGNPGGILVYGGDETYDRGDHLVCSWRACG